MKTRIIAILTIFCLIACTLPAPTFASSTEPMFSDIAEHWAEEAILTWAERGVLLGSNGKFKPDDYITRAEVATIINRIIGYKTPEDPFIPSDIDGTEWYAEAIINLQSNMVLQWGGYTSEARPNDPATREEVAVMLDLALSIKGTEDVPTFIDATDISSEAVWSVGGMAYEGYINGYPDGSFRPLDNITRAEVVTILSNMIDEYFFEPCEVDGTTRADMPRNVIIRSDGVTLKNFVVSGDLYIMNGVAGGNVNLDNVTVNGTLIVGGSANITIKSGEINHIFLSELFSSQITQYNHTNIDLLEDAKVNRVYIARDCTIVGSDYSMDYKNARANLSGVYDTFAIGGDRTATLTGGGVTFTLDSYMMGIFGAHLNEDCVIRYLELRGAYVPITGEGTIEKAYITTERSPIDETINLDPENITYDINDDLAGPI